MDMDVDVHAHVYVDVGVDVDMDGQTDRQTDMQLYQQDMMIIDIQKKMMAPSDSDELGVEFCGIPGSIGMW